MREHAEREVGGSSPVRKDDSPVKFLSLEHSKFCGMPLGDFQWSGEGCIHSIQIVTKIRIWNIEKDGDSVARQENLRRMQYCNYVQL